MVEMILSVMYDSGERKFVENYASAGQVEVVENYDRDKKENSYIRILMFPVGVTRHIYWRTVTVETRWRL